MRRRFFECGGRSGDRAAKRRVQILEELRLLRRDATPFARSPRVIRVTTRGAREGRVNVAPARLVEREIAHSVALVDLTEQLAKDYPSAELTTERELRQERYRAARGERGERLDARGRCPDALLRMPSGEVVAVELELTPKRSVDYERILRAYSRELDVQFVWWYVPPGSVGRVSRIIRETRSDDFVRVFPLPWEVFSK